MPYSAYFVGEDNKIFYCIKNYKFLLAYTREIKLEILKFQKKLKNETTLHQTINKIRSDNYNYRENAAKNINKHRVFL
jgi:hypothetical protein